MTKSKRFIVGFLVALGLFAGALIVMSLIALTAFWIDYWAIPIWLVVLAALCGLSYAREGTS